jgi:hypothetical protein
LFTSVAMSVQFPLQSVCPVGQPQTPETQA